MGITPTTIIPKSFVTSTIILKSIVCGITKTPESIVGQMFQHQNLGFFCEHVPIT